MYGYQWFSLYSYSQVSFSSLPQRVNLIKKAMSVPANICKDFNEIINPKQHNENKLKKVKDKHLISIHQLFELNFDLLIYLT